jgi:hypothetical protein
MAGDCPAVVGEETPVRIDGDIEDSSHRSVQPCPIMQSPIQRAVISSSRCHSKWSSTAAAARNSASGHGGTLALLLCTARVVLQALQADAMPVRAACAGRAQEVTC